MQGLHGRAPTTGRDATASIGPAERLASRGEFDAAIELLTEANRRARHPELERRLIALRHDAFEGRRRVAVSSEPRVPEDPFPDVIGAPPEIRADELSAELLRGAVMHHGSLIVRGFTPHERAEQLRADTECALNAARPWAVDPEIGPSDWFAPFNPGAGLEPHARGWVHDHGTFYAADSPRTFFDLLETFHDAGLRRLLDEYFGERTALSVQKCAVRRVPDDLAARSPKSKWHQDGKFLGKDVKAMNVWITFTEAGVDAPGIDVVPKRVDHIVETGTGNAGVHWCVGEGKVERIAGSTPPVRPVFRTGDALFFDEMCLHSTGASIGMTKERYSSEAWFIAESSYPSEKWVPLAF